MIKKINSMNFGIFRDFVWEEGMKDFEKDNLIYGWNYSGKTTLSKIFQSLERKMDFDDLIFELELDDGKKITSQNLVNSDLKVSVFNNEYAEDNIEIVKGGEVGPVYLSLGGDTRTKKELNEKNSELENNKKELEELGEKISEIEDSMENIKKRSDRIKTDKAREITGILNLGRSFNRTHLEPYLGNDKTDLSQGKYDEHISIYREETQDEIDLLKEGGGISKDYVKKIKDVLLKKVVFPEKIEELEEDSNKREWVSQGMGLHKGKKTCIFCNNQISSVRFEKLLRFFGEEYESVNREVSEILELLGIEMRECEQIEVPAVTAFIESKREKFEKIDFKKRKQEHIEKIKDLIELVKQKKKDVANPVSVESIEGEYFLDLSELNNLIKENNDHIKFSNERKSESKEKLIQYLADQIRDRIEANESLLKKEEEEKDKKEEEKEELEKVIGELNREIDRIEASVSTVDAGLKKINNIIEQFLGHGELFIEKSEESIGIGDKFVFALKRGSEPAESLSEGEKTIILFAYFFTNLESKGIGSSIVFIDDPISSFDDSHLSLMSAFLKNNLMGKCEQLFISTHNFSFFNELREVYSTRDERKPRLFFVKTKTNTSSEMRVASLKDLPKTIERFDNEYGYLFSLIYGFSKKKDVYDSDEFHLIPNSFRRFMECYFKIRYVNRKGLKENLERFAEDRDLAGEISAILHSGSHSGNRSIESKLTNPEELQKIIKKFLRLLEEKSKEHFECLKQSC